MTNASTCIDIICKVTIEWVSIYNMCQAAGRIVRLENPTLRPTGEHTHAGIPERQLLHASAVEKRPLVTGKHACVREHCKKRYIGLLSLTQGKVGGQCSMHGVWCAVREPE